MHRPKLATRSELNSVPANGYVGHDVRRLVEAKLRGSSYLLVRNIACEYRDGVLTLRGKLPSFYLKQIAFSLVREIGDVGRVDDLIEVAHPTYPASA